MKERADLLTAADYARVIRPLLPREAFAPATGHLGRIGLHLGIIIVCYLGLRSTSVWTGPIWCICIGHSLACLAFLAHDVSHNAVIRNSSWRILLELLLWGLNGIPPTLWRRLHNQTHHAAINTINDPDRLFVEKERSPSTTLYARLFLPSRRTLKYSPLVFFHFITYIIRHSISALMPGTAKLSIVTSKPKYSLRQYVLLIVEIGFIGFLQMGIWFIVGQDWAKYAWASPCALLVTSSVVMTYVCTNHFLNPLCEHPDPLVGSTSVIAPRWMDWLHDNFSCHTEHHVFPSMNPKFYPEVSRLLQEHFPDRYNRILLREAWRRLWLLDEFIQESSSEL